MKNFNGIEKLILENVDEELKYIARDRWGLLCFYKVKPVKGEFQWNAHFEDFMEADIFNHLFQDIKWEDSEPYKFR